MFVVGVQRAGGPVGLERDANRKGPRIDSCISVHSSMRFSGLRGCSEWVSTGYPAFLLHVYVVVSYYRNVGTFCPPLPSLYVQLSPAAQVLATDHGHGDSRRAPNVSSDASLSLGLLEGGHKGHAGALLAVDAAQLDVLAQQGEDLAAAPARRHGAVRRLEVADGLGPLALGGRLPDEGVVGGLAGDG